MNELTAPVAPDRLPAIPGPPHDPTSWRLDGRVGWRTAPTSEGVESDPLRGELVLRVDPGSERSWIESEGTFGGRTLPWNVAVGGADVYLLDRSTLEMKRFDPCGCSFIVVPCFGGEGGGARQLRNPHGIAIRSGSLFVCDTGVDLDARSRRENHRVSVFTISGFALRGHWRPPASAWARPEDPLTAPFEPHGIAFDRRGRAYVTDPANGCIHRFDPRGRWETCLRGVGQARAIAIDRRDRIYVVAEGFPPSLIVLDLEGKPLPAPSRPDREGTAFPSPPAPSDAAGNLDLSGWCDESATNGGAGASRGIFDARGRPIGIGSAFPPMRFVASGTYVSRPLDSGISRCTWHRVVLRGEIPEGTSVTVLTYTAEAEATDLDVASLPDHAWETRQKALDLRRSGEWDCLVRNGAGRYLWLKLELEGNGTATPRLEAVEVEFPRIGLRRHLPAVFGEEPVSADFTDRFLGLFDTTLRGIERRVDTMAGWFDPLSTPTTRSPDGRPEFLSWLGTWIGAAVDRHWPDAKRRLLLKRAGAIYPLRGTREGLWRQLLLLLDMDPETVRARRGAPLDPCDPARCGASTVPAPCAWRPPLLILEHFRLRRWLFVGGARLGERAVLWGKRIVNRTELDDGGQAGGTQLVSTQDPLRDPFHVHAHKFSVFVPAWFRASDRRRKALENVLRSESPAHTSYRVQYVEPRFRIGVQSMIGFDSVIARLPQGVELAATRLGAASVLPTAAGPRGGSALVIGQESTIGTTTRLG